MSEFNIEVQGGSSVKLPTGGKYCEKDIVVTASGGNTEVIEQMIDESGVLDSTEGTVEEKVEQVIDKANTDKLWYDMSLYTKSINGILYTSQNVKKLPKSNFLLATNANSAFQSSSLEEIDFFLDLPSCTTGARMFADTPKLKRIVGVGMSKMTNAQEMFARSAIEVIEQPLDPSLLNEGGKLNFDGNLYLREVRFVENSIRYKIKFDNADISAESIQSIIDGLATVETTKQLIFHSSVVAKLTDEQLLTIVNKNWTVG